MNAPEIKIGPMLWEKDPYSSGSRPVWRIDGADIAGPLIAAEFVRPTNPKDTCHIKRTLERLHRWADMCSRWEFPVGHYFGLDLQGRHRVA